MKRIFLVIFLGALLVGCPSIEDPSSVEPPDEPVVEDPLEEPTPPVEPPAELPPYRFVVIFNPENHRFGLQEGGYRCGLDDGHEFITPVHVEESKVYYDPPDGKFCFRWTDTRKPKFKYTYNGEVMYSHIYRLELIDFPELDGVEWDLTQCEIVCYTIR
jgi:hypothetical protein